MKKAILFLAMLSFCLFSSCSNDDNGNETAPAPTPDDVFSAKINGVQKNFTVTNVDVLEYGDYTDVEITAQISGDPTTTFELNLTRDSGEVFFVQYSEIGNYYQPSPLESFSLTIGENTAKKIKGMFSGTMQHTVNIIEPVTITDGAFEIYY